MMANDSFQAALAILRTRFGFEQFRSGQVAIVQSILARQDTLAILPTGGGKSLCFQVPALLFPGTTVVISPLISLMTDQVEHLQRKHIAASFLNSHLSQKERRQRLQELSQGKYKLFYLAPESLANQTLVNICHHIHVSLLVVDEAHCVSIWGHQFRPSYKKIPDFIKKIQKNTQKIPIAAFTATATPRVKQEIIELLQLHQPQVFAHAFLRENLFFHNICCQSLYDKNLWLFKLLKIHTHTPTIIYCSTRQACENLALLLHRFDFKNERQLACYHGGMAKEIRQQIQTAFLDNRLNIIIATNAFGMGVDKENVKVVIHYQISASLENYYQEAGRAGRNGAASFCYLLYWQNDEEIQKRLLLKAYPAVSSDTNRNTPKFPPRLAIELEKFAAMSQYATSRRCLEAQIDQYFSPHSQHPGYCQHCHYCQPQSLRLTQTEQIMYTKLKQINQKYFSSVECHQPPVLLTTRQIETLVVLQPQNLTQLSRVPGIGQLITSQEKLYRPIIDILRIK